MTAMAVCMTDRGFEPVFERSDENPGSGLGFPGVPPEQQSELQEALDQCGAEIDVAPLPVKDDEFQRETYEWLLGQRDCLASAGFAMPPAPSFATFADQMEAGGNIPWSPLLDATDNAADPSLQRRALEACPFTTERW